MAAEYSEGPGRTDGPGRSAAPRRRNAIAVGRRAGRSTRRRRLGRRLVRGRDGDRAAASRSPLRPIRDRRRSRLDELAPQLGRPLAGRSPRASRWRPRSRRAARMRERAGPVARRPRRARRPSRRPRAATGAAWVATLSIIDWSCAIIVSRGCPGVARGLAARRPRLAVGGPRRGLSSDRRRGSWSIRSSDPGSRPCACPPDGRRASSPGSASDAGASSKRRSRYRQRFRVDVDRPRRLERRRRGGPTGSAPRRTTFQRQRSARRAM